MFKFLVIIYMVLDILHSIWTEAQIKEIAKNYNIKLKKFGEEE